LHLENALDCGLRLTVSLASECMHCHREATSRIDIITHHVPLSQNADGQMK
jgi:hypothetical protein